MRTLWIGTMVVALTLASIRLESQPATRLVGVWKVAEIVPPAGARQSNPQPTMYLFTGRHYSHVSVTSPTPRPNYTGPDMTEKQRLEMWEPFSATAGTYDVRGNEFTIRPIVAKNPGFMVPGSFTTFEFVAEGNDIWIRASVGPGGPIPQAAANRVRLVRLE